MNVLITRHASDVQKEEDWYPATQAEHLGLIWHRRIWVVYRETSWRKRSYDLQRKGVWKYDPMLQEGKWCSGRVETHSNALATFRSWRHLRQVLARSFFFLGGGKKDTIRIQRFMQIEVQNHSFRLFQPISSIHPSNLAVSWSETTP